MLLKAMALGGMRKKMKLHVPTLIDRSFLRESFLIE